MSSPEPSPNTKLSKTTRGGGALPAVVGGLLALGLFLTIVPGAVHSATNLSSPVWDLLQTAGTISLVAAAATFGFIVLRSVTHVGRRTAVR